MPIAQAIHTRLLRTANRPQEEQRLPEHFKRTGYDADTQTYTFEDTSTGQLYESEPGNRYGELRPMGQPRDSAEIDAHNIQLRRGNRDAMRMLLPFALLAVVFLLVLFRFLYGGSGSDERRVHCGKGLHELRVVKGQTCWEIAQSYGLSISELLALKGNGNIDCDNLPVGQSVCVPV
ncbi:carbohydrate-binding module family 50 protein [Sporormia fimetaria CBS 119925]|uniref:Carbohydrate-binding module family 50 protein n=1 Tax=Sporormia fimetaria CBS 119925 TaxID=1340428 RepID=A0A6A6UWZ8_9PLEO|nr:carbohydrate-binding module family 50 protein [Sporormia fimetaria CBS 119925]